MAEGLAWDVLATHRSTVSAHRAARHVGAVAVLTVGGFVIAAVVSGSGEPGVGGAGPQRAPVGPVVPPGPAGQAPAVPAGAVGAAWVRPVAIQPGPAGPSPARAGGGRSAIAGTSRAVQIPELGLEVAPWGGEGVAVARVYRGSWAEQARLAAGDQILAFDRQHVTDLASFVDLVGKAAPEKPAPIALARAGRLLTTNITVGEGELEGVTVPTDAAPRYRNPTSPSPAAGAAAAAVRQPGLAGRPPGAALIKPFGMAVVAQGQAGGVVVAEVLGNSHAQAAGLRPGDVIVRIGRAKVHGLAHFQQLVKQAAPEVDTRIKILRHGRPRTVTIMVGEGEMEGVTPAPPP